MNKRYSTMLIRFRLMIAVVLLSAGAGVTSLRGDQVYVGTTLDYTPGSLEAGTVKSWTMPWYLWSYDAVYRNQFASTVYSTNELYANQWRKLTTSAAEGASGCGGVVWHFQSGDAVPMDILITPMHYFGNDGGNHFFEVYFSDENDWGALSSMTGGSWSGGVESNAHWTLLYSDRSSGAATASGALAELSLDGDFWVRVDIGSTAGGGVDKVYLNNLVVKGTVISQVEMGHGIDFTPSANTPGTTVSWQLPWWQWINDDQWRTEFIDEVYSFNALYGSRNYKIAPMASMSGAGCGGMVWHFQGSNSLPMDVAIDLDYSFNSAGAHNFEVYFSDENDFGLLSPMSGGTPDALESNTGWKLLYSDRSEGSAAVGLDSALAGHTLDGDFYVRVDMGSSSDHVAAVELGQLSVTGTVAYNQPFYSDMSVFGVVAHTDSNWDEMAELGCEWIRKGPTWEGVEGTAGVYDTADWETQVQGYLSRGMKIMWVMAYENSNYPSAEDDFNAFVAAYAAYCGEMASRFAAYHDDMMFEIWNEPDGHAVLRDGAKFATMARAAAGAIKAADPEARVAALANAWFNSGHISKAILDGQMLKDSTIDFISWHAYHRPGPYGGYMQKSGMMSEYALKDNLATTQGWVEQARAAQGFSNPVGVILSETGYAKMEPGTKHRDTWRMHVYDDTAQAAYLARHYLTVAAAPIEMSIWYKDMWGEKAFSLYSNGIPESYINLRKMGYVYQTLATELLNRPARDLVNDRYTVSVTAHDSSQGDLVAFESFVKDGYAADETTVILGGWYQVEVFEGRVLTSRWISGNDMYETWRDIEASDKVTAAVDFTIADLDWDMVVVETVDLVTGESEPYCDYTLTGGDLTLHNVALEPMPTILTVRQFIEPDSCVEAIERGYQQVGDLNGDCHVTPIDLAAFSDAWLDCSDPANPHCQGSH